MTPRAGWTMPTPPTPEHVACADLDGGDGWRLYWATPDQLEDWSFEGGADDMTIAWPFDEGAIAGPGDMEAIGFRVVGP